MCITWHESYLILSNNTSHGRWDIVEEEEFHSDLAQIDGAIITPESLTPNSSPEHLQPLQLVSCPSPEWDHSPERLMEDNAFLWEVEPLRALTAQDILHDDSQDDQQPGQVSGEEDLPPRRCP